MPQYDSLKSFYGERATLAYCIEHQFPGTAAHYIRLERYDKLQAEIHSLEAAFAQTWRMSCATTVLLPWCSMCGNLDRELLPGQTLCSVCVSNIETGTITPGEHAEAERTA